MTRVVLLLCATALGCGGTEQGSRARSQLQTVEKETKTSALYERGRAFAAVGDFTRAEEYFASALENGGDSNKLIPLLLYCCMQDGRFRLAAQYAEEHLRKHPNDQRTRFVLGSIYAGLGDESAAQRELERVIEANNNPEAHFALAQLLYQGPKAYADADRHYREYLRLAPSGPHAAEARERLLHEMPPAGTTTSNNLMPMPTAPEGLLPMPMPSASAPAAAPSGAPR